MVTILTRRLLDGCSYLLQLLDGCCHFLEPFGWLMLFPRSLWIVAVFFQWPSEWLLFLLGALLDQWLLDQ